MPNLRFYVNESLPPGTLIRLPEKVANHASKVLRLHPGTRIQLFNGDGFEYCAELHRVSKDEVSAIVLSQTPNERESPLQVTLVQAISSGERMDFTLQKAVELGVTAIQPLSTERSIVRLNGERAEKRRHHWQNIVVSACEQCGRSVVPLVGITRGFTEWLSETPNFELKLILSPIAETTLHEIAKPSGPICLLIGCEGGFSPHEIQLANQHGFTSVRLGARILRTESAGLAAIASMQTLWGDF